MLLTALLLWLGAGLGCRVLGAPPAKSDWWAFQPATRPALPTSNLQTGVSNPIDRFIRAKLAESKLGPSAEADPVTLIRRLTYDLTGLPPTPEEVETFVSEFPPAPPPPFSSAMARDREQRGKGEAENSAYERLVDRLLASPRHGERWARHWLDVVHFGETHGYDKDKLRPHAWPYRDYVIRSLNDDKPWSRFVEEQLAGDALFPDEPDGIVALGFIAAGPWDFVGHVELPESKTDGLIARYNDRDDMVMTTFSAFQSLTVHCARCHDHKFDPISQQDYYSLQAVFAGVDRANRSYDTDPAVHRRRRELTAEQRSLERLEREAVQTRLAEITNALAALPAPKLVYAAASDFKPEGSFHPPKGMRTVHLLLRGDVKQPKQLAPPAALAGVPGPDGKFNLATNHTESMRRAALAKWLTDPRNLQTRRSIVNRVWQYHFGRGLVDTPNDFGHMGSVPSHPELLDWLAFWFMENGESLKRLHRLIVTSATYRQASSESVMSRPVISAPAKARSSQTGSLNTGSLITDHWKRATALDADNRLLWRQNRTRLDAECIRDTMLAVSGQLNLTMGGPSDRQFHFKDDHSPVYDYTRFDADTPAGRRRSIYRLTVRSAPDPFMDCLDAADPSQLVARRNTTLTALQALATLNNPFVLKQCEHFAARLKREARDLPAQIERAYRLTLSRPSTAAEKRRLAAHSQKHGLASACRVLFNSTEFMFVD